VCFIGRTGARHWCWSPSFGVKGGTAGSARVTAAIAGQSLIWARRDRSVDKTRTVTADGKILTRDALLATRARARADARSVVHCHGCFDIVHPGHVRHLRHAKALGDVLLVTITSDAGVGKGVGRPLIPEELRAENLAALDCVDWVHIDPNPTAEDLLEQVRPDIFVKGKEYETNEDPRFRREREAVERHGGRVVFSSGDVVFSSTALIAAMESSADPFHARLSDLLRRPELEPPGLFALISAMRGRRVVVVGETIIDEYVHCDRPDIAGEGPMMTLRPLEERRYDAGAAIVARHAASLGARPVLVTALPDTEDAEAITARLAHAGVEVRSIRSSTPIPRKQRFLVGAQKVMKVDHVQPVELDAQQQDRLVALALETAREAGGADAATIVDFALGLFTPTVMSRLCRSVRPHVNVMTGDVSGRRASLRSMQQMDLLCPSEPELRDAYGMFGQGLPAVTWRLLEETSSAAAMITLGPEGMIAFDRRAGDGDEVQWRSRLRSEHIPAMVPHAIDALGCGDAALALATLTLTAGGAITPSVFLAAAAAAVEAQSLGNIPVGGADVRRMVNRVHAAHLSFADSARVRTEASTARAALLRGDTASDTLRSA